MAHLSGAGHTAGYAGTWRLERAISKALVGLREREARMHCLCAAAWLLIWWTSLLMGDEGHRIQREEHIGICQHTVRG